MTISAYAVKAPRGPCEPFSYQEPTLGPYDIEVLISHCGICHSDLSLIDNAWKISSYPLVPGHEIVGHVQKKGTAVSLDLGQRVGIGWQRSACLCCTTCFNAHENNCLKREATCVGHFGGYADRIYVDARFAFPLPEPLDSATAAPLLCAGATTYSPFRTHGICGNKRVGVIGIGGLGHLAIQFSHALGCHTTAVSHSSSKQQEAKELGADQFLLLKDLQQAAGTFDFILSTVNQPLEWSKILRLLRPRGILCIVGMPLEPMMVTAGDLINGAKVLCGSSIGSRAAIEEMLEFSARNHIAARVEVLPMNQVNEAIAKVRAGTVRYRMVLETG